jgi:hypothetical protein
MRVKAIKLGYYGEKRQRPGQVFSLSNSKHFSEKWMIPLDEKKGSKKAKQEDHIDESESSFSTGDQEVI